MDHPQLLLSENWVKQVESGSNGLYPKAVEVHPSKVYPGAEVGAAVGVTVGSAVGVNVGTVVVGGLPAGVAVGSAVGVTVGSAVGVIVGDGVEHEIEGEFEEAWQVATTA